MKETKLISLLLILISIISIEVSHAQQKVLEENIANNTLDDLFKQGFSCYKQNDFEGALEYFDKVLVVDNKYEQAWFGKMRVLNLMGKYKEELDAINEYLQMYPDNANVWGNKALTLCNIDMYALGEEAFAKAISMNPKEPWFYFNRGTCRLNNGNYEEALSDFTQSKEMGFSQPERAEKYITIINILIRQLSGKKVQNMEVPQEDWKPNYEEYLNIGETNTKDTALIFVVGVGTRISFKGTQESPFMYAPNLFVWNGAVINDNQFGVLLENGTQFRYLQTKKDYKIERQGDIKAWKAMVISETKEPISQN